MTDFAPQRPREEPQAQSEFTRSRWTHSGTEIDQFFQRFVPSQYEDGFCWRCKAIGEGEETRTTPFDQHPRNVQELIARNAEVLLELYEETSPSELDRMRESGKILLDHSGTSISLNGKVEGDIPSMREGMARRHHEKWLAQFREDLAAERRQDPEHRGAKPFDELPDIELLVMKVQTLANWRVLGSLSDQDYHLVRGVASKRENGE